MASTPTKTIQSQPLAWQIVTSTSVVISAALDVSTAWKVAFPIRLARRTGTAFTAGWPNVYVQASSKASGNNSWISILPYQMQVGASIANTTLNGAVSAGATTFVVTSATNISVGDTLFLGDTSTANYEIVHVKAVSGTTITPWEVVVNAHANAAIVTDQSEEYFPEFDVSTYTRLRIVVDNSNSGQDIAVEVGELTMDSF